MSHSTLLLSDNQPYSLPSPPLPGGPPEEPEDQTRRGVLAGMRQRPAHPRLVVSGGVVAVLVAGVPFLLSLLVLSFSGSPLPSSWSRVEQ